MNAFARLLTLSAATACLALALGTAPALAKTTHHKHHVRTHHSRVIHHGKTKAKAAKGSTVIRIAQEHLSNLGYYTGKADGIMGSQTKAAIKRFQREHGLKSTGKLDTRTINTLENADRRTIGTHSQFMTHETVTTADQVVNQDYATSLNGGTKVLSSRFARLDVSENGVANAKRYAVTLNGQPLLIADGQPSIIGMSQTFDLGNEDAVVFTTYSPNNGNCMYKNHVLALNAAGAKMLDIENCTRNYQAQVNNGSLYISFPEHDSSRTVNATWRLEGTSLERL